jgi:hypothetical protein
VIEQRTLSHEPLSFAVGWSARRATGAIYHIYPWDAV